MRKVLSICLAVVLGSAFAAAAEKAPPAKEQKAAAPVSAKVDAKVKTALHKALEQHIRAEMKKNDGVYPFYDEDEDETLSLTFVKLAADEPMMARGAVYIVRAAFLLRGDPEFGEKDATVLCDFTLMDGGKGWEVSSEVVYSVNGTARYYYTKEFKRMKIGAAKDKTSEAADEVDAPISDDEDPDAPVEEESEEPGGGSESEDL